jgi:hypothetical protein
MSEAEYRNLLWKNDNSSVEIRPGIHREPGHRLHPVILYAQDLCMDPLIAGRYNTADGHTVEIQYRFNEFWYGYVCEFRRLGQRSALQKWNLDGTHPEVPGWSLTLEDLVGRDTGKTTF